MNDYAYIGIFENYYRGVEQLVSAGWRIIILSRFPDSPGFFMFTVYVLYSEKFDKIYIGMTSDLESRFLAHNELSNKGWTKKFRPWKIIYKEVFNTKTDALKREKELKSFRGRVFIRKQINNRHNSIS